MIEHSKPSIGKEEEEAALRVLRTKFLAEGDEVRKFEAEVCACIGAEGALATSTGTFALHLALLSLHIGKGDEVILPSYTCRSVLNAVLYCNATPVICDVNTHDYTISLKDAQRKITRHTKALLVAHMFGCPAPMDAFKKLGIPVIEDCAHAVGAVYLGRKVGSWGDLSVFSFEGTKYMVTGEGGMVLANNTHLCQRLRSLKEPDSLTPPIKYTCRMTDLQAAIGRAQLKKLPFFIEKRRYIAKRYHEWLKKFDVVLPLDKCHIFHRYMIQIKGDIHSFMDACLRKGVKVKQPVKPFPLHRYVRLPAKDFPVTEYLMHAAVSVPLYPSLTEKELNLIEKVVSGELKRC